MTPVFRGRVRKALLVSLVGFAAVLSTPGAAAGRDFDEVCAGPIAELKDLHQKIKTHNAQPRVSSDRSYVSRYNAEARRLNAQQVQAISRARACARAFSRVQGDHPLSTFVTPRPADITKIKTAVGKLTEAEKRAVTRWNPEIYDFLDYGPRRPGQPPKKGMTMRADRAPQKLRQPSVQDVYKALDETRPDIPRTAYLQGVRAPAIGSPDPAYADRRLITGVAFDHILPLRRLVTLRDFLKLTPENMYLVANSPANSQWLSKKANGSKLSGSSAFISGADSTWLQQQAQLREKTEREVRELIDALLKTQKT